MDLSKFAGWKEPIAVGIALVAATASTIGYLHSEFATAADFKNLQSGFEARLLEQRKQTLETDRIKLEAKKEAYPKKFDAVDRALQRKVEKDLKDVEDELRELRRKR